jgi:hypothetical protein
MASSSSFFANEMCATIATWLIQARAPSVERLILGGTPLLAALWIAVFGLWLMHQLLNM